YALRPRDLQAYQPERLRVAHELLAHRGSETEFELATIERLERLGYRYIPGIELDRPPGEVVLRDRLRTFLAQQYPDLPRAAIEDAVALFSTPAGADTLRRNMAFHDALTRGIEVRIERSKGRVEHRHVYPVDWDHPERNEFLVVNQLPVRGQNDR